MAKNSYWEKRELDHINALQQSDEEYNEELHQRYTQARREIRAQINDFYARYADKEGISIADAKMKVATADVQGFAATAKKMTEEKDFSAEANEKLRLYNATMRINRLEMLKSQIGVELIKLKNNEDTDLRVKLEHEYNEEYTRQAGILGENKINSVADDMDMVVNGSYKNATFSDRIWSNQDTLKSKIDSALTSWLIRGDKPTGKLADDISKAMDVSKSAAERLMLTESSRISTEAEKRSFEKAGIEYYWVVGRADACETYCKPLIIKSHTTPLKVSEIEIGVNVPPVHPRCRCVMSAASEDWDDWNQWLDDKGLPPSSLWSRGERKTDHLGYGLRTTLDSIDGGISTKKVIKALEDAPENMQKMWDIYKDKMSVYQLTKGEGADLYNGANGEVALSTDSILGVDSGYYQKPYDVVFHEFGHMIDHYSAKNINVNAPDYYQTSQMSQYNIPSTMKQDYDKFMEPYINKASNLRVDSDGVEDIGGDTWYNNVKIKFKKDGTPNQASLSKIAEEIMIKDLSSKYDLKARGDISDMMTGPSGKPFMLGVGHDKQYFNIPGKQETEMFAEMTSATINNPESLALIKKIFPESYKKYEQMVNDIVKAGG